MAMAKLSVGIGLVSGPSLGSLLNAIAGFSGPFLFFAVIFALLAALSFCMVPESVEDDELSENSERQRFAHS